MPNVFRKRKRIFIAAGVLLLLGLVVLNALAYRHAYAMMHFTKGGERTRKPEALTLGQKISVLFRGVSLPRPQSDILPEELGAQSRRLVLDGNNGIKLGAWYLKTVDSDSLVILFHGYGGEKSGTLREAHAFAKLGYSVMLVDFRGSGDSSESYTTIGYLEAEDVLAATTYAREQLGHKRVVLYGKSMGAAAVLRAVHSLQVRVDAIIVEAVFDRLLTTVCRRFDAMGVPAFPAANLLVFWGGHQVGFDGFQHNPLDYASQVRCPALFMHGAADPRARLEDAQRVFEAVPSRKAFHVFPNLGHENSVAKFPTEWSKAVADFLKVLEDNPKSL